MKSLHSVLGISVKTIEMHRAAKLGIGSLAEPVRYAIRNKVIDA